MLDGHRAKGYARQSGHGIEVSLSGLEKTPAHAPSGQDHAYAEDQSADDVAGPQKRLGVQLYQVQARKQGKAEHADRGDYPYALELFPVLPHERFAEGRGPAQVGLLQEKAEKEMNELTYELYGLTEEEIKLVEEDFSVF